MNQYTTELLTQIQQDIDNNCMLPKDICKKYNMQPTILYRLKRDNKLVLPELRPAKRDWTSFVNTVNEIGLEGAIKHHNTTLSSVHTAIRKEIIPSSVDPTYTKRKPPKHYSITDVQNAVQLANCWSDVLLMLGVTICSFNMKTVRQICEDQHISHTHFNTKETFQRNKESWTFDEIFCVDSKYGRSRLRAAAMKYGLYNGKCAECDCDTIHNNKPLTLELDHINGVCTDNRVENLRFLCPNCHSQTPTYRRRSGGPSRN